MFHVFITLSRAHSADGTKGKEGYLIGSPHQLHPPVMFHLYCPSFHFRSLLQQMLETAVCIYCSGLLGNKMIHWFGCSPFTPGAIWPLLYMCRRWRLPSLTPPPQTSQHFFWKEFVFAPVKSKSLKKCTCGLQLFVLYEETSVCFRICVELACLLCKILIAHCIYEGSWKRWSRRPDEKCIWSPHRPTSQRADAVSPLFSVLVLWMNYLISSFPFSQPHPLTSLTCSVRKTPNHSVSAVELSYAEAVTWTVFHRFQGRGFYGDGYWVVMLTTVVGPALPPNPNLPPNPTPHRSTPLPPQWKMWYSFGEVCFCRIPGFWRKIISPVSIWPSLCWLQWIKALK